MQTPRDGDDQPIELGPKVENKPSPTPHDNWVQSARTPRLGAGSGYARCEAPRSSTPEVRPMDFSTTIGFAESGEMPMQIVNSVLAFQPADSICWVSITQPLSGARSIRLELLSYSSSWE